MSQNINILFKSFVNDIIKVFPEYSDRLNTYYQKILTSEEDTISDDKLDEFMVNIDKISSKIADSDVSIFQSDPILLQNISFKMIWGSKETSSQTKNSIWKYLQSFCIHNINKQQTKEKTEAVKKCIEMNEKITDKETLRNMKKLKKLTESLNKDIISKDPVDGLDGMDGMEEMFQNTSIGKIAKELTEELNIESMVGDGGGGIEQLFTGDNMMNIMQSIGNKVSSLDNSENDIMKEAMDITKVMNGNPLFSSLMSGLQPPADNTSVETTNNTGMDKDFTHNSNNTKRRLQNKLKERQSKGDGN